jgi:hypothetical protein
MIATQSSVPLCHPKVEDLGLVRSESESNHDRATLHARGIWLFHEILIWT